MNTTLKVDKEQDVMDVRLVTAEENYGRLRLDSDQHNSNSCPVCMHLKLSTGMYK